MRAFRKTPTGRANYAATNQWRSQGAGLVDLSPVNKVTAPTNKCKHSVLQSTNDRPGFASNCFVCRNSKFEVRDAGD
jgi:hypothetical protein